MSARLQRRLSFEVRRDAAVQLSNGRIMYDALFSRTGFQRYPKADGTWSIEYRPPEQVFRADSLASLAVLPGALLHPSVNFGTSFGVGSYPVRGATGERIVAHSDGVHTAGKLMVWDDEWNALIESGEVAELSLGYTITPGPAGIAPDGTAYDVMHMDIVGDHVAGVPAGNAGTARVITDALPDPAATRATRRALADIAAMRMDARPLIFDLGRWPNRETETTTKKDTDTMDRQALANAYFDAVAKLGANATPKAMADAWVEICGSAEDPAIRAAAGALASAPQSTYVQANVGAAPSVEVEVEVGMQDARARLDADRKAIADERAKLDAERKAMADAQAERDDAVQLARDACGLDWTTRTDAATPTSPPKSTTAIKREIVDKVLGSARLAKIDGYPEAKRTIALDLALEDARERLDANRERGGGLLRVVEAARNDNANGGDNPNAERLDKIAERHKAQGT